MTDSSQRNGIDRVLSRRRFVAAVGTTTTVGLAGCSQDGGNGTDGDSSDGDDGGGGDGGGGDGDGMDGDGETTDEQTTESQTTDDQETTTADDGGETTSGDDATTTDDGSDQADLCTDLTADGYTRHDEADSPFVGTFEHPGRVAATATVNNDHSLTIRVNLGDRQPFDLFPEQRLQGTDSPTAAQKGELDGLEQVDEIEFAGETVPLIRAAPDNAHDEVTRYTNYPYYIAGLPYEGSEGKQYYRFMFRGSVAYADELEAQDCLATYEEVAQHLMLSLEPNTDTTVEDEGV